MDVLAAALALLALYLCYIVYRPLRYERSASTLPQRKLGPLPPPYPSSWFRVCWSEELRCRPIEVKTFGRLLRVGRSPSNKQVHTVDYCCAAQGCAAPFACAVHQPASLRVEELLGVVLVWHGDTSLPTWELPSVLLNLRTAPLVYHGHTQHKIPCHVQELPENGPDSAHLSFVHRPFMFSFPPFAEHRWENVTWRPADAATEPHIAHFKLTQRTEWLGLRVPLTQVTVHTYQIGLGVVLIKYYMPPLLPAFLGGRESQFWMLETVTPEEPLLQRVGHIGWGDPIIPRPVAKLVLAGSIAQFERDIPIWSKKTYLASPLAVRGDGPLLLFRRWVTQFYPKKSTFA